MKVTQLDNNWHNLDNSEVIKSFGLDVSLGLDSLKTSRKQKSLLCLKRHTSRTLRIQITLIKSMKLFCLYITPVISNLAIV